MNLYYSHGANHDQVLVQRYWLLHPPPPFPPPNKKNRSLLHGLDLSKALHYTALAKAACMPQPWKTTLIETTIHFASKISLHDQALHYLPAAFIKAVTIVHVLMGRKPSTPTPNHHDPSILPGTAEPDDLHNAQLTSPGAQFPEAWLRLPTKCWAASGLTFNC